LNTIDLNDLKSLISAQVIEVLSQLPGENDKGKFLSPSDKHPNIVNPSSNSFFSDKITGDGPWDSFREFLNACKIGTDSRLEKAAGDPSMTTGDPEAGGFMVPEGYTAELLFTPLEEAVLLPRVRKVEMTSGTQKFPRVVETSHASNLFGGIQTYWKPELGEKKSKKPALGMLNLRARDLTGLCYFSDSLLQDSSPSVEKSIKTLFSQALNFELEDCIFNGLGDGQPLGILQSGALISVDKEAAQPADTFVYENAVNMYAALHPAARAGAVWVFHPSVVPQLLTMSLTVGAAGSAVYVSNAALSPPEKIFGLPVFYSEHLNVLGDAGDALLCNPKFYMLGMRKKLSIDVSIHLKFEFNQTAIRFVIRADGMPQLDDPLTLKDGSTQVSPFVSLKVRG